MPEEVKVELEPEVKDESQEKVDVTPSPTVSAEDQLAAKIRSDFEALYGSRVKDLEAKLQNQLQGARRIEQDKARLQQEVDALKAKPAPKGDPSDPWAGIENGATWKAEIERLAEQKADQKLKAWQVEQAQLASAQQYQQTIGASKQRVIAKYPDLHPETGTEDSLVAKTYQTVITEHPDWLSNPYGPELAMYAMEEKLKADASGKKPAVPSGLPPSRPAPPENRITLTREQKALCDRYGWKYEDYAKIAQSLDANQGAIAT